jgi:subtilisin family serine protease
MFNFILSAQSKKTRLDRKDFSKKQIIVKFRKNLLAKNLETSDEKILDSISERYKIKRKKTTKRKSLKIKRGNLSEDSSLVVMELEEELDGNTLEALVDEMNLNKIRTLDYEIEAAYLDHIFEIQESETLDGNINDIDYPSQWNLNSIKAESAWKLSKGEGVVIAVIDTGIDYRHKDLAENIWINEGEIPDNGIDDDNNGFIDDVYGWDFVKEGNLLCEAGEDCSGRDNDPQDFHGHGTHVAGIIAAVQNNNFGISGIAPKAKIMPLRAAYSTGSSAILHTSDIIDAISYAINNGADVINMSFAGYSLGALKEILDLANDLNIVLVAAAGNLGNSEKIYPAALDSVIAVGALDQNNYKAYISNYGDWVDIAAPGVGIYSTSPYDSFKYKTGTSMAAPQVAGVAALIISKNKLKTYSSEEIRELIKSSAEYLTQTDGLLKLNASINYPLNIDQMEVPEYVLLGSKISFEAQANDSNYQILRYEWNSSIDGFLSNKSRFELENLSEGSHTITVRAENSHGDWSDLAHKVVNVSDTKIIETESIQDLKVKIKKNPKLLKAKVKKTDIKKVGAYKWISNKDGEISNTKFLRKKDLSSGYHQISLRVQNLSGIWSEPIERVIRI